MRLQLIPIILTLASTPCVARDLTLAEALGTAEGYSPLLKAARLHERSARENVGAARSYYYPRLDMDGVDSWGFAGSSGYLGLGGIVGSPYRKGMAGDVVARDTLFDFGRTQAKVTEAKAGVAARAEEAGVDLYKVDEQILVTYYQCARFRSEHEVWNNLHSEVELVASEVARFVDTGQRSVVDRYLSQAQVEEARTNRNYFLSRALSTQRRLKVLMGEPEAELSCPGLPKIDTGTVVSTGASAGNPYIARAETEVDLAKARVSAARAEYLPRLVGVASVGGMDHARLVPMQDYSGGLGVVLPLFSGFGTVHDVGAAKAELEAKAQELGAVQLQMDDLDAKFQEIVDASRARIEHLEREERLALEGFRVAKTRYFKFQGTLVDLRDALRNLGRIEIELRDTQADLLEAAGAQALLNGKRP